MGLPLVTAAEYKAYIGITSTNQDAEIASVIPKVSELVKSFCRRTFLDYVDESKVEVFKGGESNLNLKESPLLVVGSVEFSEDYGLTYAPLVEFTDYVIDTETDQVNLIPLQYQIYKRVNAFKVTYNAGYEAVPADLKLAIFDLITYYLRHEAALHTNKAVGANSVQIEYVTNTALPAHIRRVLDLYCANYL
jgi:hypothetical protein